MVGTRGHHTHGGTWDHRMDTHTVDRHLNLLQMTPYKLRLKVFVLKTGLQYYLLCTYVHNRNPQEGTTKKQHTQSRQKVPQGST